MQNVHRVSKTQYEQERAYAVSFYTDCTLKGECYGKFKITAHFCRIGLLCRGGRSTLGASGLASSAVPHGSHMGTHSEKCTVRQCHRCVTPIERMYANLGGTAYCTPRLHGVAYGSQATSLFSRRLYRTTQIKSAPRGKDAMQAEQQIDVSLTRTNQSVHQLFKSTHVWGCCQHTTATVFQQAVSDK